MSRVEELEKQIQELQKELELEKQKEVKCPFKYGDEYFLLPSDGMVSESIWGDYKFDNRSLSQGNIFKTKEEAEREHDKRELLTRFRQFRDKCNGEWEPDFEDGNSGKHYIILNHKTNMLRINFSYNLEDFNLFGYFRKESDARRAIQLFGDEIKRLWVDE